MELEGRRGRVGGGRLTGGSRGWRRLAGRAAVAGGVILVAVGALAAVLYGVRAVQVLGQPDRSWLFWGLGLLLPGIILGRAGVGLLRLGRELGRRAGPDGGRPTR